MSLIDLLFHIFFFKNIYIKYIILKKISKNINIIYQILNFRVKKF